jgi:hypothetical protein
MTFTLTLDLTYLLFSAPKPAAPAAEETTEAAPVENGGKLSPGLM